MDHTKEIMDLLEEFNDFSHLPGPILKKMLRMKAELLKDKAEEEKAMILYLVESHVPSLRLRAEMEIDSNTFQENTESNILKKENLSFSQSIDSLLDKDNVKIMFQRVTEMPKEWTIVQITPQFHPEEIFAIDAETLSTYGIHITIFNCGENQEPYCVTLQQGVPLASRGVVRKLENNMKGDYLIPFKNQSILTQNGRRFYEKKREDMEDILESILYDLEEIWLGAWKCLLIGKYKDETVEIKIRKLLNTFLKERSLRGVSKKIENILVQAVKASLVCSMERYDAKILEYCFPDQDLVVSWQIFWKDHLTVSSNLECHPIILVLDETLDAFPWEMLKILSDQPSSRMPSLHLIYAIYKAHEESIVDGYKVISNCKNGKYIVNPGIDLEMMETRMKSFYDYWLPEWSGIAGKAPSSKEFMDFLTCADIFSYSGHGSGAQYCSSDKIQKKKVNPAVFLFGCGSSRLVEQSPEVEMFGTSQMYLLAGCPCLIGMLWIVTDSDTDLLTSNLLSFWVPNQEKDHWKYVDQRLWKTNGKIKIEKEHNIINEINIEMESNLLKALCLAKKKMKFSCNKAAVIARGIPIKLCY